MEGNQIGISEMGSHMLDFKSRSDHQMAADPITIYCQNHDHLKPFPSADEWNIILWKTWSVIILGILNVIFDIKLCEKL